MPTQSPRAATQGPRDQRKRPGDLTGTQGQRLAQERDERQAEELAAAAQAKVDDRAEKLSSVVDYTQGPREVVEVDTPDEPMPETMRIRVNYPIEDMTFGREVVSPPVYNDEGAVVRPAVLGGLNTYNFEEGREYVVPFALGAHLKGLGYVYDF